MPLKQKRQDFFPCKLLPLAVLRIIRCFSDNDRNLLYAALENYLLYKKHPVLRGGLHFAWERIQVLLEDANG